MKFWNTDTVRTKKCTDCGEIKPITEFYKRKESKDGHQSICKECSKRYNQKWNRDNKERKKKYNAQWNRDNPEYQAQWREDNKEHIKEYQAQWKQDNPEYKKEYKAQYYQNNKEHIKEYMVQWNRDNKEHKKEYNAQWNRDNPEYKKEYQKEKYHSDPLYRMKQNLRNRINSAFKSKGWSKDSSTQKMLGCDWETLKIHMESKFKDGMSWDNIGEWHIDHIIPLDCAIDEEEIKKLCHYTNLQPLWGPENQSKSNKVLKEHYDLHYKLLGRYYK